MFDNRREYERNIAQLSVSNAVKVLKKTSGIAKRSLIPDAGAAAFPGRGLFQFLKNGIRGSAE